MSLDETGSFKHYFPVLQYWLFLNWHMYSASLQHHTLKAGNSNRHLTFPAFVTDLETGFIDRTLISVSAPGRWLNN